MRYPIRAADFADREALTELIARSARALGARDYTPEQIEGALGGAFGVDTQLIRDRTYFAVEHRQAIVACGGWSYRRTLFGGDAGEGRDADELDPAIEAAKVRAFFVDPAYARQGIGAAILERCEAEAWARGFRRTELMATLTGARMYAARGYVPGEPIEHRLAPDLTIRFIPMSKTLLPESTLSDPPGGR